MILLQNGGTEVFLPKKEENLEVSLMLYPNKR